MVARQFFILITTFTSCNNIMDHISTPRLCLQNFNREVWIPGFQLNYKDDLIRANRIAITI